MRRVVRMTLSVAFLTHTFVKTVSNFAIVEILFLYVS